MKDDKWKAAENVNSKPSKMFVFEPAPGETSAPSNEEISSSERKYARISHLSGLIFFLFGLELIVPLVILFTKGNDSKFVLLHSWQAFLFQTIMFIIKALLILSFFGMILIPFVIVFEIVLFIIAGMAAHRGELYSYPFLSKLNDMYEI